MRVDLYAALKKYFGFSSFREGQEEVIRDVLQGKDVLGILPTGTGKSLCYQLPSKVMGGTTLVISPLISLMVDQVKQLKSSGFQSVTALNSFMDKEEKQKVMNRLHAFSLVYISPEMLQNQRLQQRLQHMNIKLFVIDEAHCISQWGHEFRTDYLKLDQTIDLLKNPPVLALSATATPEVQQDIMNKLRRPHMKKRIYPMDKQNISLAVEEHLSPEEKTERIIEVLTKNQAPTMIYFSSRQWAEKVSFELRDRLKQRVAFYHGGMEQTDRMLVQQQFMNNQLDVICCTSAFGMGLDKKDIRIVIHFHLPPQLESFIQEIGRAGRDGEDAVSLLLFTRQDHHLPQRLIQSELPEKKDLNRIFSFLQKEREVPEDEDIMERFQLSESQWNFVKFKLEEEGMIRGRWHQKVPSAIQQKIEQSLENRWVYKQNKLTEMMKWIYETDCRRTSLYKPFQEVIRKPHVPCCDACDFKLDELSFCEDYKEYKKSSWEERLSLIFSQGVLL
ncbi:RecQ family ATP-dependent DNA helicase [Halobacillus karajensis]|uniref:ATP-dependent DNA helicase RecQ n=1 Tax=Halobacillus karajensis TaxID=195088 RepID=A0A024P213_9BACI|nr:RecQ family ATP-dependent DNA helicase [Halobacillus karajensis]CDQ19464.1 ATP-dependent DNA helicase RecQ [Halobacillus karajensis]CDQ21926.1 ATP-dependent DNA helicase RecQ [Halobacillus karajensis]CDQ27767.1 ATP-dependent DNA helicase RecQ [Halobacillus karajensis]